MDHDIENFDRDKLISDFIENFSNQDKLDQFESAARSEDLGKIQISDYDPPEEDDEVENKIESLKQLVEEIEKNSSINYLDRYNQDSNKTKINYKSSLNPAQYYAVVNIDKPLLVIAGAGSGKTRTVVYRVAYLLEKGIDPTSILLLTFTRKAAGEMILRASELLGNQYANQIVSGTFHAFSNYCLRKYANWINIPSRFSIIDGVDAEDIISLIRDELVKKKDRLFPKKARIYEIISKSKNLQLSVSDLIHKEFSGLIPFLKDLEMISIAYEKYKEANFLYDYDDLLIVLAKALEENSAFRKRMQKEFKYVMVDEYQDTNLYQREIVRLIAQEHQNIMAVGDDSQSIYAFRGAKFENILEFPKHFPQAQVVKIEQNYRSNQGILDFSNSIIRQARLAYRKELYSEIEAKFIPQFKKFYSQEDEAKYIVDQIVEARENGIPQEQIAVLVRASFHSNFVQTELLKRSIPYVVVGGIKFTERRHVRDMVSFLRILMNPFDASAWHRILKLLPGIGNASSKQIIQSVRRKEGKINFDEFKSKRYYDSLALLQKALLEAANPEISIVRKIEILREFYNPIMQKIDEDAEKRNLDLDVLNALATKYERLDQFLSDFALDPPSNQMQDSSTPLITEDEEKPVTVSTIHSAKGLEWHTVFIPHLIDGLFPSSRALKSVEEMEEERRLFYVACTRAKEVLNLSMPSSFASWDKVFTKPSRFLVELDKTVYRILK